MRRSRPTRPPTALSRSSTRRRRPVRRRRSPTSSSPPGRTSASTSTQQPVEQSQLILAALLGDQSFEAFGWRNHAGLFVDTQNSWWHGFGADAIGSEVADGLPNLNFGRLNDPVINDLLDQARETQDNDERRAIAQDINRQFAEECWILPYLYTTWGIIMNPSVQNIGRDPLPDHDGYAADGAGFPGQVWLTRSTRPTDRRRCATSPSDSSSSAWSSSSSPSWCWRSPGSAASTPPATSRAGSSPRRRSSRSRRTCPTWTTRWSSSTGTG